LYTARFRCSFLCSSLLFLSLILPPLRSTLFPYTTLFRSLRPPSLSMVVSAQLALQMPPAHFPRNNSALCRLAGLRARPNFLWYRSEEHTSELQSRENLVCRLLLEKKKKKHKNNKASLPQI